MFRATVSSAMVINGYQIFGQVINRVGKIPDFGHKQAKHDGELACYELQKALLT